VLIKNYENYEEDEEKEEALGPIHPEELSCIAPFAGL